MREDGIFLARGLGVPRASGGRDPDQALEAKPQGFLRACAQFFGKFLSVKHFVHDFSIFNYIENFNSKSGDPVQVEQFFPNFPDGPESHMFRFSF